MTARQLLAVVFVSLVMAPAVWAQDTQSIVFGAFYRCNQATEARTDTIYQEVMAPIFQKHVDAGHLTAYGWNRHRMGGAWRRLSYVVGTDLDAMLDAQTAYIEEFQRDHAEAVREFNTICSSHDDYIWYRVAGSQAPEEVAQERPNAGLSSYMVCDSREAEADEIMETAFAPILNGHVESGRISSWLWLEHNVGGWYRRALVLDAADYKTILNYWNTVWQDIEAEQPELLREFGAICDSHQDYVWDLSVR